MNLLTAFRKRYFAGLYRRRCKRIEIEPSPPKLPNILFLMHHMTNMVFLCCPRVGSTVSLLAMLLCLLVLAGATDLSAQDRYRSENILDQRQENPLTSNGSGPGPTPLYDPQGRQGPPSWAQEPFEKTIEHLKPFGANLFAGNFARTYYDSLNPGYEINVGDRIEVKLWGAKTLETVLVVD